ncbi:peptide deformylase [Kitasatospora arboriphila]|uniref:Peptide deformylase n=1 Tax=Kitasatospora arboriphila TaxID=258052 RepID=A0ABN1TP48_9ACTN
MGVAAPQLGIDRAVAIVRTADAETITLLNPRVIEESAETDEQYEGCWSFFDVRGMVPRPRAITVEHQEIDGQRRITIFENAVVRLVAHEIDHLEASCTRPECGLAWSRSPVSECRGTGQVWSYGAGPAERWLLLKAPRSARRTG